MPLRLIAATLALMVTGLPANASPQLVADPTQYVDPLIGTGVSDSAVGDINNFPGPSMPFGMMQFSPDTEGSYAGYQYDRDSIRGFSLDHASVGCTAFGDIPILPVAGEIGSAPWQRVEHFGHAGEQAEPGYYAVTLSDSNVRAELTATTRTGLAAFTYPAGSTAQVLVKAGGSLGGNSAATVELVGDRELRGSATTGRFCGKPNKYTVYYAITFDQPFTAHGTWDGSSVTPGGSTISSPRAGAYLTFGSARTVKAKVSMSYVGTDGAKANQVAELPGWDLDAVRQNTRSAWKSALGKIRVSEGPAGGLKTFYTALYHSLMHPNTFNDVDGRYIGFDDKIHQLPAGRSQYANFSDWDTYRSLAPLHALLFPAQASDMAQSLTNDAVQGGWWPRWPLANGYTGQMTGDSSVALLANLYAFGARDFDTKTALQYLVKGATSVDNTPGAYRERPGIDQYVARGYLPNAEAARGDHGLVGASITLEWAIDDFGIARFARGIGNTAVADQFDRRAQNWQNVFNPATGYVAPRGNDGRFPDGLGYVPPAPGRFGQDGFDEGNAAQYSWMVPQNSAGLITAMGGPAAVAQRLDTFFTKLNVGPNEPYMWAGNEPDFGVPWLYNHVGQPWKTQATVRKIATTLFSPTPNGEPGNDDLGAQSSWYVWAALGIYPGTPGAPDLVVHSPLFQRAVISLPNGRTIDLRAPQAAPGTPYVQSLRLEGRTWNKTYLPQSIIRNGGRLDFRLGTTPNRNWATDSAAPSYRIGEKPFLASATKQLVVAPGGSDELVISAQRLGGHDKTLEVSANPPAGLTVVGPQSIRLNSTGGARTTFTVRAAVGTAAGYYEVPVVVKGRNSQVSTSALVLVGDPDGLIAAYDNVGISDDTETGAVDLDNAGNSFSRQALADAGLVGGGTGTTGGTRFVWPDVPVGRPDNVAAAGQTIVLDQPATQLSFVGTATNGDHKGTATVTFTDGTTAETPLAFGDWVLPGPADGWVLVAKTTHRNPGTGATASVYATTPYVAPPGKILKSIRLPADRDLHVFTVGLGHATN